MSHFLDSPPYLPDRATLLKRAGLEADSDEAEDFLGILDRLLPVARPKAFVTRAVVDASGPEPDVLLDGVLFSGSILYENLKDVDEAWPYVATCGREMYDAVMAIADPFERFWGEIILEDALGAAIRALDAYAETEIYAGKTASIAPGSLPEWPIEQQAPLFSLLGEGARKCGVTLTPTLLMIPNKSVSGIRFPNEHGYVSCRLCPRENCPNRKAEYNLMNNE